MLQVFTLSYLGTNAKMGSLGRLSATCPDLQAAMLEGRAVGLLRVRPLRGYKGRLLKRLVCSWFPFSSFPLDDFWRSDEILLADGRGHPGLCLG